MHGVALGSNITTTYEYHARTRSWIPARYVLGMCRVYPVLSQNLTCEKCHNLPGKVAMPRQEYVDDNRALSLTLVCDKSCPDLRLYRAARATEQLLHHESRAFKECDQTVVLSLHVRIGRDSCYCSSGCLWSHLRISRPH